MDVRRHEILWISLVLACLYILLRYQSLAGEPASPPHTWPAPSQLSLGESHTLLLFVHPGCTCTRASLRQLERFTAKKWPGLKTYAIFSTPPGTDPDFHHTDLWRLAERVPLITARLDQDGRLSREFGCQTSGQVLLYDGDGRLQFSGGITDSRGHEGDSVGLESLDTLLRRQTGVSETKVYGCPLFSEGDTLCHP